MGSVSKGGSSKEGSSKTGSSKDDNSKEASSNPRPGPHAMTSRHCSCSWLLLSSCHAYKGREGASLALWLTEGEGRR